MAPKAPTTLFTDKEIKNMACAMQAVKGDYPEVGNIFLMHNSQLEEPTYFTTVHSKHPLYPNICTT